MTMNQTNYINQILLRFGLIDCKPKSVPCDLSYNKENFVDSEFLPDNSLFRDIVGCLIYLMVSTRPDLSFVVTKLSESVSKHTEAHLSLAKFVLRYLKGTQDFGLTFYMCDYKLFGYSDSDWANSADRRSISGYIFKFHELSSAVSWRTKKQSIVALSSCEAEYIALTQAVQESKFLNQLLIDMVNISKYSVTIYADNHGAIQLANNPVHHKRSKHIDVRYHYIREETKNISVNLIYVPSEYNLADMFTKPVSRARLKKFDMVYGL